MQLSDIFNDWYLEQVWIIHLRWLLQDLTDEKSTLNIGLGNGFIPSNNFCWINVNAYLWHHLWPSGHNGLTSLSSKTCGTHFNGSIQEKRNSSALALELHFSCINAPIGCKKVLITPCLHKEWGLIFQGPFTSCIHPWYLREVSPLHHMLSLGSHLPMLPGGHTSQNYGTPLGPIVNTDEVRSLQVFLSVWNKGFPYNFVNTHWEWKTLCLAFYPQWEYSGKTQDKMG